MIPPLDRKRLRRRNALDDAEEPAEAIQRQKIWASAALMMAAALGLGCAGRTGLRDLDADSMSETRDDCSPRDAPACQLAACGDGIEQPLAGESCDDGGRVSGDGCSSTCQIEGGPEGMQLVGGFMHTCALLADGRVKCWGLNNYGQLGLGDENHRGDKPNQMGQNLPAIDLGTGNTAVAIAAGASHTCALLNDGRVRCWGANEWGQLGVGDAKDRGDEPNEMGQNLPAVDLGTGNTAVAITAGSAHTCALLNDGHVKCWGANEWGQLGLGDENHRGDKPNEMGDNLPAVNLGTGMTAVAITAGSAHTCARMSDSRVKCWGDNESGQLGLGDAKDRGDKPNEMGDNLPAVNLGTGSTAMAIIAGGVHSCALLSDGRVKCWGNSNAGQLGLGGTAIRGNKPNQMGDNLPAVDLGTGLTAVALAASALDTCALLKGGRVKCWGWNLNGELGLGDMIPHGDKPNQMGDNLPTINLGAGTTVAAISASHVSTCARMSDGRVKCWGDNESGQLGLGDESARGDEPNEMGDNLPHVDL